MISLNDIICARLKELFKNESQYDTAEKLNMSQGNLNKIINGKQLPQADTLDLISKKYHVSVDWILGIKDSQEIDSVNTDNLDYAQIIMILDKLITMNTISLENEKASDASDHYKIEDPTISYLLRLRMKLLGVDDTLYEDWKEKHLAAYKQAGLCECDEEMKNFYGSLQTSKFKEGDWSSKIIEFYHKKKNEGEGKDNG